MALFCPITQKDIDDIACVVITDVVNGIIKEDAIDPNLIDDPNYKSICKKCQKESGCIISK